MPVLDATQISGESDLQDELENLDQEVEQPIESAAEVSPGPIQSITLILPAEYETTVVLLIQQSADGLFHTGYRISRAYETSPYERNLEQLPDETVDKFDKIHNAIDSAWSDAVFCLEHNSSDDDEKTQSVLEFLDDWYDKLEIEDMSEALFDPLPEAEKEPEFAMANITPSQSQNNVPTADSTASVPTGVSTEAQAAFDSRKHKLEEVIGKLAIEQVQLKAAVKRNRESLTDYTEQLENHLLRGPDQLPLFDRQPKTFNAEGDFVPTASQAEPSANESDPESSDDPIEETATHVASTDESWRAVKIQETSIPTAICKILNEDNQLYTLGQIADYTTEYALTNLTKIGQAKAERIEEALTEYWADHPRE